VCAFVSSVIQSFLVRHGFASNRDHPKSRDSSPSPRKRRKLHGDKRRRSASVGALPDRKDEEETEIDRNFASVLYIRTVWIISYQIIFFCSTFRRARKVTQLKMKSLGQTQSAGKHSQLTDVQETLTCKALVQVGGSTMETLSKPLTLGGP
jgi:hypothetical protein